MRSFFFEIFLMLVWVVAFLIVYIIARDVAEKRRQQVAEIKDSFSDNIEAYYQRLNEIGRKRERTIIIGFIVVSVCGIAIFAWLARYGFKFHWTI